MLTQNTDINQQNLNKVVGVLLDIMLPTPLRLVNDNIEWTYKNNTYTPFPFKINGIEETTKGEIPKVTVSVSNVTNLIASIIQEDIDNTPVKISVVRFGENTADIEFNFVANGVSYDEQWLTFELSAPVNFVKSFPSMKYSQVCPFVFKGWQCKYNGNQTSCDHSAKRCKALGNYARFGGFTNETV